MITIGNKLTFGFDIGDVDDNSMYCHVDTYVNDYNISLEDNEVYIPGFVTAILQSIEDINCMQQSGSDIDENPEQVHMRLRNSDENLTEGRRFLMWGPTTNSLISFIFPKSKNLVMTCEFISSESDSNHTVQYFSFSIEWMIEVLQQVVLQITPGKLSCFRQYLRH